MKNVLLIYGGESVERDISILTALQVWGYINSEKYHIVPAYIDGAHIFTGRSKVMKDTNRYANGKRFYRTLKLASGGVIRGNRRIKIDCALLATHGGSGENGALQGMLEYYNIAYTSCDHYTSKLTMDKYKTLDKALNIGISAPKTYYFRYGADIDYEHVLDMLGGKAIVKPNSLGSSIGVSIARNKPELVEALAVAFSYDNEVIIQEVIGNLIELNCAAMIVDKHVNISDVEEPIMAREILDFDSKYRSGGKMSGAKREFPANIDSKLREQIRSWTLKVYRELGLYGVVRIDYLYDKVSKKLYLNEINSIPGSLAYYLFVGEKFNRIDFITALIEGGIARLQEQKRIIKQFDSSLLSTKKCRKDGTKLINHGIKS